MQQNGPKEIGFFGTRNMGWMHQQLIEVLSYAMVLTVSGAAGSYTLLDGTSSIRSVVYSHQQPIKDPSFAMLLTEHSFRRAPDIDTVPLYLLSERQRLQTWWYKAVHHMVVHGRHWASQLYRATTSTHRGRRAPMRRSSGGRCERRSPTS